MQIPTLYLLVGYPGAGKTTVSKIIAQATGAMHIWADHERHKMFQTPTHSALESQQLYTHLNTQAASLLAAGKSVVFDTNFNFFKDREHLRRIALKNGARTVLIWVTTPKELARERSVEHSHEQETRIWGNMPLSDFLRISRHLQPPRPEEQPVKIDGTHIDPEAVRQQLGI
jgi:predicted kinase